MFILLSILKILLQNTKFLTSLSKIHLKRIQYNENLFLRKYELTFNQWRTQGGEEPPPKKKKGKKKRKKGSKREKGKKRKKKEEKRKKKGEKKEKKRKGE